MSRQGTNDTFAASAGHTLDFGGPEYQRRRGDHYNPPVRQILKPERSDKLQTKKRVVDEEFPVKPEVTSTHIMKTSATSLAVQVGRIAREKGLNAQDYMCSECKAPLELNQNPK
nr:unnamed protein product [Callosobruchus analis]